ncbi:hypothetical protein [Caldimonas caldifontis]|uniref:Cell envelope biogenesis protein TolA n=1 Tax=Caldimonas caldifontis TaxID=1452508 RepID=A0A2S5SWT0_9BURK|nr:hypothetical protein [Caldimonas caldifontis]PPE67210.1 hypothetical protein C1704_03255 [Caldimonas caldifontis]
MKSNPAPLPSALTRTLGLAFGALALSLGAQAATGDKAVYEHARAQAKAQYETAKAQCKTLAGNAKDVCEEEAKATRKKLEAEAKAVYEGTPKARYQAQVAIAEADYEVAEERCDDRSGDAKDLCKKEAKAMLSQAKASAKAEYDAVK